MNIHGVWLIKLIVLQKYLHFQGQFFPLFFLFASLASAWSFHQSCSTWTPTSVLSLQRAHFNRFGEVVVNDLSCWQRYEKELFRLIKMFTVRQSIYSFCEDAKITSCYLCEQHVFFFQHVDNFSDESHFVPAHSTLSFRLFK